MTRYVDESTYATDPGEVELSLPKLRALDPELFADRTFTCGPTCDVDHPSVEMRERLAEHLMHGDSRAALVVSVAPLVVAAYSSDLDAVALLRFPTSLVSEYGLTVGSRLLTVNLYADVRGARTGEPFYAVDLVPGPDRTGWSNFAPLIADFLSEDRGRIEARKRAISEDEWRTAKARAATRIERWGLDTARPGTPTLAGTPVRLRGRRYFRPMEALASPPPGEAAHRLRVAAVLAVFLLFFVVLRVLIG